MWHVYVAYSNICFWHYFLPLKSIACKSTVTDVSIILDYKKMSIRLSHFRFHILRQLRERERRGAYGERAKKKEKKLQNVFLAPEKKAQPTVRNGYEKRKLNWGNEDDIGEKKNRIKLLSTNYWARVFGELEVCKFFIASLCAHFDKSFHIFHWLAWFFFCLFHFWFATILGCLYLYQTLITSRMTFS